MYKRPGSSIVSHDERSCYPRALHLLYTRVDLLISCSCIAVSASSVNWRKVGKCCSGPPSDTEASLGSGVTSNISDKTTWRKAVELGGASTVLVHIGVSESRWKGLKSRKGSKSRLKGKSKFSNSSSFPQKRPSSSSKAGS